MFIHFQHAVMALIHQYGYGGLFLAMTLANIGAPVGSEVVLPAAGALVATGDLSNLWATISVAVAGELSGGAVGYAIGRFGGRPFVERFGKYVRFHHSHLDRGDAFFDRYGTFAIFICRFIPVVRGIVAIPAGIARMNIAAFALWTALGSTIFCGGLILLGNELGMHVHQLTELLHRGTKLMLILSVVLIVALALAGWIRSRSVRA